MGASPLAILVRRLEGELAAATTIIDMVASAGGTASSQVSYRRGLRAALAMAEKALEQEQHKSTTSHRGSP